MRLSVALMVPLLLVSGCGTAINEVARKHASHRGIFIQSGARVLGLTYLRTEGYVPGVQRVGQWEMRAVRCHGGSRISVAGPASVSAEALHRVCGWVGNAVPRMASGPAIRFQIQLVPVGTSFHARRTSLTPVTPLTLRLVVPWYSDEEATRSNLVDLLAHEAFHLHGFISNPGTPQDEVTAYWIGLCAQLRNGVRLAEANLPGGELAGTGESGEASSWAAARVRMDAAELMKQGEISAGSPNGARILARCDAAWARVQRGTSRSATLRVEGE